MYNKDEITLILMLDTINKIQKYVEKFTSSEELWNDNLHFDAVMMNFISLGETVDKLSDDFKEKNNQIEWFKIKAFRNIIAHDYFGVDASEVWQIIKYHLPKLKNDLQNMSV